MKKAFYLMTLVIASTLGFLGVAFAQDIDTLDFLSRVLKYIQEFGGLESVGKISAAITLIVSTMKVSFIKPLWDKLGTAKAYVAPALGFIGGLLAALKGGQFDWAVVAAWTFAGGGAVFLHEILDTVKAIPGIGSVWITVIEIVKGLLKAPKDQPL